MSSDAGQQQQVPNQPLPDIGSEVIEPRLLQTEEPADDSLLTFEEDVEFDPLKRSDSIGLGSLTGSFSKKTGTPRKIMELSGEPAASSSPAVEAPPPLTSRESLGHIQDLTGVDLSMTTPGGGGAAMTTRQSSLSELLQSGQMTMMVSSSAGVMPGGIQIVSAPSAVPPQGQMPLAIQPGGVVYGGGAAQGQVPLTIQAGAGGVAYGGGAQTIVPVMYAAQGTAGVMYQVSKSQ